MSNEMRVTKHAWLFYSAIALIVFVGSAASWWAGAQLRPLLRQNAVEIEGPGVFDCGVLFPGQVKSYTFAVANRGSTPVLIDDVKTDCSCAVAKVSKEPIVPGAVTKVDVRLDTLAIWGKFEKQVLVRMSTGETLRVSLHGTVNFLWTPSEGHIKFTYRDGATAGVGVLTKDLQVSSRTEWKQAHLVSAQHKLGEYLDVTIHDSVVTAKLDPARAPANFSESLVLAAEDPGLPGFNLRIRGERIEPYQSFPRKIIIGPANKGDEVLREIRIIRTVPEKDVGEFSAELQLPDGLTGEAEILPAKKEGETGVRIRIRIQEKVSEEGQSQVVGALRIASSLESSLSIPIVVVFSR